MKNGSEMKNNDSKKILTLIILIATIMISTTGATYAYFAFSASSNNTITGTAATASISFSATPSLIAPPSTATDYTTKPMVPQKALNGSTNVLQKALTGVKPTGESAVIPCVDANKNVVCRAYTFTIKNDSTATAVLRGRIKFNWASGSSFTNLKWKLMTNATTVAASSGNAGLSATTAFQDFETNISLAPDGTKQFWVIVWIEETGAVQNSTDYGTWYGTIEFINNTDGSGLTSTITS